MNQPAGNRDNSKQEDNRLESGYDMMPEVLADSIKILVSGKTGSGKTTLVNGIIGVEVQNSPGELSKYEVQLGNIRVTVWDSPGLQDGTDASTQEMYLQQMKEECSERDLSLYCIKISDTRFVHSANNPDVVAMKKLTWTFGHQFWEDCVIVLTYANTLPAINIDWDSMSPNEQNVWFQKKIKEWQEQVREILIQDIQLPNTIVQKIKIVPAGHYRHHNLPGLDYWFSNLWFQCADAIRSPGVRQALAKINQNRMKTATEVKVDDFKRPIQNQPIVATDKDRSSLLEIIGGGIAGGVTGGVILGLVGLVAGPPTVAVTLPIGALIGMIVGGGGTATGVFSVEKTKQCFGMRKKN